MTIRALLARLLQAALILLGVAAITFGLLALAPADPARMVAGRGATALQVANVRHELGLDRTLPVRFAAYLGRLAHGDLGRSYVERAPVSTLIASRAPATLELLAGALVFELLIGIPAGMFAAFHRGGIADRAVMALAFLGASVPQFVLALALLTIVAAGLGWFPIGGYGGLSHLVLPSASLGLAGAGWYGRIARSSMIGVLDQDFIEAVRAKGASPARVALVHAARNAALPVLAMIGIDVGTFASGAVVTEAVFGWPGIGQLTWQAIRQQDIPVIMAVTLIAACAIVLANLAVDIAAPLIDPRLRGGG